MDELDPFLGQDRRDLKTDILPGTPTNRDPGIRRHEMKRLDVGDDRDLVFLREERPRLIGRRQSTDRCADDHHSCHGSPRYTLGINRCSQDSLFNVFPVSRFTFYGSRSSSDKY